jgi:hypothetical protein
MGDVTITESAGEAKDTLRDFSSREWHIELIDRLDHLACESVVMALIAA